MSAYHALASQSQAAWGGAAAGVVATQQPATASAAATPRHSAAAGAAVSTAAAASATAAGVGGAPTVCGGKYAIKHKIGAGSFGEIYLGVDTRTGARYAVKMESTTSKYPQLEYEYRVYQSIKQTEGLAQVHWYGTCGNCNVMVMDLLGETLENLYNKCKRTFSMKTVTMLAVQLLDRLQHHHENHYLHRDIKPDNFLMGLDGPNTHLLYIIDMGLCKRYRDPKTREHIPYKENKKMIGTPRYASVNAHLGIEQSRRDDLESLGYLLVYFLAGELPWQGLQARTKQEKYDKISKKKCDTPVDALCGTFPKAFSTYLSYCRSLKFDQEPDYDYLRGLFYNNFREHRFVDDYMFDWSTTRTNQSFLQTQTKTRQFGGPAAASSSAASAAGGSQQKPFPPGFTVVSISHGSATSIPGAIIDEKNGLVALPPGYTSLPAYDVILPPGAVFDEPAACIRYEGRIYPVTTQPSQQQLQREQQQQQQQQQQLQQVQQFQNSQLQHLQQSQQLPQQQLRAQQLQQQQQQQQQQHPAVARTASGNLQQLSITIPVAAPMEVAAAPTGNGSGSSGTGTGAANTAVPQASRLAGAQTPVPMPTSSPIVVVVPTYATTRQQLQQQSQSQSQSAVSPPRLAVDPTVAVQLQEKHSKELEQWMEAYEQMEADRDKWHKKSDEHEKISAAKTTRLDEYERLTTRLKQEINRLREHMLTCPHAAAGTGDSTSPPPPTTTAATSAGAGNRKRKLSGDRDSLSLLPKYPPRGSVRT